MNFERLINTLNNNNDRIMPICKHIEQEGGTAYIVGGYVRDFILGLDSKDIDIEVFGLSLAKLEKILHCYGEVVQAGRSFGVLKVKGLSADFSLPRRDTKLGQGHTGFEVKMDPNMTFEQAAKRRDLTINAIGFDPVEQKLIDPYDGLKAIENKILKAVDVDHFGEDPLRALRVAQFAARFSMHVDKDLLYICSEQDLSEVSGERIFEEFKKLLLKSEQPSLGLSFLKQAQLLKYFPELEALINTPQDKKWHPEGDVWVHTLMVVDQAAQLRNSTEDPLALMLGALCHDLGKPKTTIELDGKITAYGHDMAGVEVSQNFLEKIRAPKEIIKKTSALVKFHLMPPQLLGQNASDKAYRRLARKVQNSGLDMKLLLLLVKSDLLGRTTSEALSGQCHVYDQLIHIVSKLDLDQKIKDVVQGKDLIAKGIEPGRNMGKILERCSQIQDETGIKDVEAIIDQALASS